MFCLSNHIVGKVYDLTQENMNAMIAEIEHQAEEIQGLLHTGRQGELEEANEELAEENNKLREQLDKATQRIIDQESRFLGAGPAKGGGFELNLKPPKEIMEGLVIGLAEAIQEANYAEMTLVMDAGDFTVSVQRKRRPTPHEKRKQAEENLERLATACRIWKKQVDEHGGSYHPGNYKLIAEALEYIDAKKTPTATPASDSK